ncbi:hypothetical protein [Phyllobacterium endophyticum]|uniref:Uncharacterized protein n=1 Tax=Phyllobacterium endophyticum TaxID=1149773 RepID=A0A2P7AW44_9HYPH|nr:hypothetical protein [Phyllobacterium endophyticum]MBB3234992.1 hypothetical protein [Phyllobacterium endophyticum]PSH58403.1 hypothetical protein CU100_12415 [Phyllobacterium endophyticum]TYR39074.1 hypothetical protein FY050_24265 [Phyllobacterium endophyticum]
MGSKKTLALDVIKVISPSWMMVLGYLVGIAVTSSKWQHLAIIYLFAAAGLVWSYPIYRHRFPFALAVWLAYPFLLLPLVWIVWAINWLLRLSVDL